MPTRSSAVLVVVLVVCGRLLACADNATPCAPAGTRHLHGAGATVPAPLDTTWREEEQHQHAGVQVISDTVGNGAGTKRFLAGAVDFGASDATMRDADMATVTRGCTCSRPSLGVWSWPITWRAWGVRCSAGGPCMRTSFLVTSPPGMTRASPRRIRVCTSRMTPWPGWSDRTAGLCL